MDRNTLGLTFDAPPSPTQDASPDSPPLEYYIESQCAPAQNKHTLSTLNKPPLSPVSPTRPKPLPLPSSSDNDTQTPPSPSSPVRLLQPVPLSTLGQSYSLLFPAGHHISRTFLSLYYPLSDIGSGGFGFVLTARNRRTGVEVAVKFIEKEKVPDGNWVNDPVLGEVPVEVSVLRCVRHDGIIGFEAAFEDTLYFYLVQELHGSPWQKRSSSKSAKPITDSLETRPTFLRRPSYDLFECIEQHSYLPENIAKYIFAQVVDIVLYLDSLGVVHRDIKDENLLVDENFKVKLIDFGSAVIVDPSAPQPYFDKFFGTLNFAASEILQSYPYRAQPAEVWSMGVLLSYLITGESPFPSAQDAIEGNIRFRRSFQRKEGEEERDWEDLMRKCLQVDVKKRATIQEIRDHNWLRGSFEDD